MNIYDLNTNELREIMKQFGRTVYGRTIFMIAYFVPMVLFVAFVGAMILAIVTMSQTMAIIGVSLMVIFAPVFMIAHAYYYRELRAYVEHFQNSERARIRRYFNK